MGAGPGPLLRRCPGAGALRNEERRPTPQPPVTGWLITNQRVAGRLFGNILHWWTWEQIVGARIDLTTGRDFVQLDLNGSPPIIWTGPGVSPRAVATVYHLHGATAMLDHPGLAPLRNEPAATKNARRNIAAANPELEPSPPLRL